MSLGGKHRFISHKVVLRDVSLEAGVGNPQTEVDIAAPCSGLGVMN